MYLLCLIKGTRQSPWFETVASRMGQNARRTANRKQNLPPPTRQWERPCFYSGTVSTQRLCLVRKFLNKKLTKYGFNMTIEFLTFLMFRKKIQIP